MPIRDNDPRPAYQQLADELRQAIAAGRYEVGDRLPSTRELSESHGIAPMTVPVPPRMLTPPTTAEVMIVISRPPGTVD